MIDVIYLTILHHATNKLILRIGSRPKIDFKINQNYSGKWQLAAERVSGNGNDKNLIILAQKRSMDVFEVALNAHKKIQEPKDDPTTFNMF